jgi:hypothetical protein
LQTERDQSRREFGGGTYISFGNLSPALRLIVVPLGPMLEALKMVLAQPSMVCRRVVIDDRSRLPGRFFGRFATSATSELTRAL